LEVKVIGWNKIIIFSGSFRRQEQPSLMNDMVLTGTLGNQHKMGEKKRRKLRIYSGWSFLSLPVYL
jgi:hypothetical protein